MLDEFTPAMATGGYTSMLSLPDPDSARRWCREQHRSRRRIGFVPTMGALHAGHLSLVRRALADNDCVCVSVFVNPLQFNDAEDFRRYPRDPERDRRLLESLGCNMVFSGTLEQFFPESVHGAIAPVDPGPAAAGVEGDARPDHFSGVATIVRRLFEIVGPACAYFGEKDFQQTLVVRHVAAALGYPRIEVCPTVREADGIAMSSRNVLLDHAGRPKAAALAQALFRAREAWNDGVRDADALRETMLVVMRGQGVECEYAELRDPEHWQAQPPQGRMERAQALVAATVHGVRLIDTLRLDANA